MTDLAEAFLYGSVAYFFDLKKEHCCKQQFPHLFGSNKMHDERSKTWGSYIGKKLSVVVCFVLSSLYSLCS